MLALVAFVELVAVGVALALRSQENPEPVVVERVVKELVPLAMPAAEPQPAAPVPRREEVPIPKPFTNEEEILAMAPPPLGHPELNAPPVDDPVVERLVLEAREARVRDDYRGAIVKLEEAEERAPNDPTVLYVSGEVFEAWGLYDKAADYYQRVFQVGLNAGSYYELASHKLSHGFEQARRMEGKLALGRVRQFIDKRVKDGEKVVISVPIMAAPDQKIDPSLVDVKVLFFDKINGEVSEAMSDTIREPRWITEPVDWKDTGEELLQVTYFIPKEEGPDVHLLGERKYHGQVVELKYSGDLLDHQAWPRTLAKARNVPEANPLFIPEEWIPEDLNEANPLLPPLPKP